jgi:uncharacterized LabA/DUF88 family protein
LILRTHIYIDGFNLYYGCLKGTAYRWLDLLKLSETYLNPSIEKIKYFTADIIPRKKDPDQATRQQAYLRALNTFSKIEIIRGKFLSHVVTMPLENGNGFAQVIKTEEKQSDVNIASHMLMDAFQDKYDLAVLVSNDSDLSEPVRMVTQELGKKVGILNPSVNPGRELSKYALFQKRIRQGALKNSLLPETLLDTHGKIHKPKKWS